MGWVVLEPRAQWKAPPDANGAAEAGSKGGTGSGSHGIVVGPVAEEPRGPCSWQVAHLLQHLAEQVEYTFIGGVLPKRPIEPVARPPRLSLVEVALTTFQHLHAGSSSADCVSRTQKVPAHPQLWKLSVTRTSVLIMKFSEALVDPTGVELWRLSSDELLGLIADLGTALCAIDGLRLRAVADADRRGAGIEQGAASTQRWLSGATNVSSGAASRAVRLALGLERAPQIAAALGVGQISAEHARVILHVLADLPDDLPDVGAAECETYLLDAARQEDPQVLSRRGQDLLHRLRPDAVELTEEQAVAAREFRITASAHPGLCKITGFLDTEAAELAKSVLSPLAAPRPAEGGRKDLRTPARRMGDAFVELCQRAADHACVPGEAYTRPHITLSMDAEALISGRGATAQLAFLGPLSVAAARRLACDCEITPLTLDEHGVPLDVGRSTYIVSGCLRRALIARDHGCAFPGCGRPPNWCHAHHRIHWADGGPTALDNLVLLCGHHHRLVHHSGWAITLGDDRHPWFIPPPWVDPEQLPRPSHARGPAPPLPAVA